MSVSNLASILVVALAFVACTSAQGTDCSTLTDCTSCTSDGGDSCVWCPDREKCLPPGSCLNVCQYTEPTQCPTTQSCSSVSYCRDCVLKGCGWCSQTNQCLPASTDGKLSCNTDNPCNDNGGQCFHGPQTDGSKPPFCPSVPQCSALSGCGNCTKAGCAWCGASQTCMEATKDGKSPCGDGTCADCFKTSEDQCPAAGSCSAYKTCRSCATGGCGWCASSQTCMEVSSEGKICDAGSNTCDDGCVKTEVATCPAEATCSVSTSCSTCISSGCHWCASSQTCLEAGTKNNTCATCPGFSGCLKSNPKVCPTTGKCSDLTDCKTCGDSGCAWCATTQSCAEMTSPYTTGLFCAGPPGTPSCSEVCWKRSPIAASNCPATDCASAKGCRDCTALANCGWESESQTCIEANVDDNHACTNEKADYFSYTDCNNECVYPQQNRTKDACLADSVGCGYCEGYTGKLELPLPPNPDLPNNLCLLNEGGTPPSGVTCQQWTNGKKPNVSTPTPSPTGGPSSPTPTQEPSGGKTTLVKEAKKGDTSIFLQSEDGFSSDDKITIGGENSEENTLLSKEGGAAGAYQWNLKTGLKYSHAAGSTVVKKEEKDGGKKGLGGGAIAAIIFGVFVGIGIVGGAVWYVMKKNEGSTLADPMMAGGSDYAQIQ